VEVIGEEAKRVSADARDRLASLDRMAIFGMRDVLIHDYIGGDLGEVWNVASSRIPELRATLDEYLGGKNPDPASAQEARTAFDSSCRIEWHCRCSLL
jgi:uncharacterized protein with HEPN domain